jgi:elongation factor Ts
MAEFSAKDVQRLRQATGAGMMDAKRALTENEGDFEAAAKWLREKGLARAVERADRASEQGAVAIGSSEAAKAIVELVCETDYVAKSTDFTALVQELADAVAAAGVGAVDAFSERIDGLKITLKENIGLGRVVHFSAGPDSVIDSYLHIQNDRGVNAVLVEVSGASLEVAHDIALHVGFSRPAYLSRDEVPADLVAQERATLETISRNEGKPEAAMEKIVEGRLGGWYKERVLLDQAFVKDTHQTIAGLLGDANLVRFAQVEIGR